MSLSTRKERRAERERLKGKRVQLIHTTDTHTRLRSGAKGTVAHVDAMNTLHVDWDDGTKLGLIPGVDFWKEIP